MHPSDLLTVNLGPSHPATHGALRAEILLDGETILEAKTEIGYIHRCFEKEAEDHTWAQVMPYTDRLNYCSAMLNNSIYASAVEKLLGVEITPRAQAVRVIVSELSRIIDHLVCVWRQPGGYRRPDQLLVPVQRAREHLPGAWRSCAGRA